jgi:type VI secretion system protein ImpM
MTPHERRGTGFYGKVRTNGDFVGRGLPHEFIAQWDVWLQRGLVRARERDGDDWLSGFLGMPVWCFSMKPGVIDASAFAGVMMPGIDAVGRYFPFAIARPVASDSLCASPSWYEDAAILALSTLMPDFAMTRFEAALDAMNDVAQFHGGDEWQAAFKRFRKESDGVSAWWVDAGEGVHVHEGPLSTELFLHLLDA